MKRYLPLLIFLLAAGWLASTLLPPAPAGDFDLPGFGRLPVLANGRVEPLDSVARNALLTLQGRQRVADPLLPQPLVGSPIEWLADMAFNPRRPDTYPTFRIDSPELLTLMGITEADTRIEYPDTMRRLLAVVGFIPSTRSRFTYNQLAPRLGELQTQAQLAAPVEPKLRTSFQQAVFALAEHIQFYNRLQNSIVYPGSDDFLGDLLRFQDGLAAGAAAIGAKQNNQPHDEAAAQATLTAAKQFEDLAQHAWLRAIPPAAGDDPDAWHNTGEALLGGIATGDPDPGAFLYAGLAHAWRQHRPAEFNDLLGKYHQTYDPRFADAMAKSAAEARFNAAAPFYSSMLLFVTAFLLAVVSWLRWPDTLGRSAFWLLLLAWLVTTAGIGIRMWLEGRPPVTNLYSSALFIGWGAVGLCLVLEKIYRNAIGSVAGGLIGFGTLLIAHFLSLTGDDTMEMMQAVLDSNFWLATHVVVVTIGYASTFLAGFLALIYVVMGLFTRWLERTPTSGAVLAVAAISPLGGVAAAVAKSGSETNAKMLERMVYGITCFATLFSFVGTVLGGIWADQSWGRFWGWDPKENGALIIVLWNALILHARWGGLVKQRGLMALAIFGNIVTSWSWFGTNMLGIGLHSYGFTNAAFVGLIVFVATQLAFIALTLRLPARPRAPA